MYCHFDTSDADFLAFSFHEEDVGFTTICIMALSSFQSHQNTFVKLSSGSFSRYLNDFIGNTSSCSFCKEIHLRLYHSSFRSIYFSFLSIICTSASV